MLQEFLGAALQDAYRTAIEHLDRQSAEAVLDMDKKFKTEVTERVVEIIHRHTISDKFKDEEVGSNRVYPPTYRVRPVEAQVIDLRKLFPSLGACNEKLARRPLPEGAEAWFAIPRWQALAPSYNEAVEILIGVLGTKRRFSNRIIGKLGEKYLRQSERSKLAEKILADASSRIFGSANTGGHGRQRVRIGPVYLREHVVDASGEALPCRYPHDRLQRRRILGPRRLHVRPRSSVRLRHVRR